MRDPIYLVDASHMIFRAFHATPRLTTRAGLPTNAVYGFGGMLLKLLADRGARLAAVCFDAPPPTFRHEIYPEYKATRPPTPEDLLVQLPYCRKLAEALGLVVLEIPEAEADDVIASMTRRTLAADGQVVVVSSDKDLMQLVGPGVVLLDTMRDITYDERAVQAKFQVEPARLADLLALMGDSSDNIPGAPGIGPKTAARLLARYGTLDAVIEAARTGAIKGAKGRAIAEHAEQIRLSRRLVALREDLPLDMAPEDCTVGPIRAGLLEPLLAELEFHKWMAGLEELYARYGVEGRPETRPLRSSSGSPDRPRPETYVTVTDAESWNQVLEVLRAEGAFAVDLETTALDPIRAGLVGVALSAGPGRTWYVPVGHSTLAARGRQLPTNRVLEDLRELLESAEVVKYAQNHKYEYVVFRRHGIELRGVGCDPMIASYLLDPSAKSHGLDALAARELGYRTLTFKEVCGTGKSQRTFDQVDLELATRYAGEDAEVTYLLAQRLTPRVEAEGLSHLFYEVEIPLARVLGLMELTGIKVDVASLQELAEHLERHLADLEERVYDLAGRRVNLASQKQLQELLFVHLGLEPVKRTKTGFSTDAEVLEQLAARHPVAALIHEHRTLTKLLSTYVLALPRMVNPETGRIHTSYNQAVAATGRLSSSDPNLQNIPVRTDLGRRIRRAFVAEEGHLLVSADYSQIELRVLAHLSQDPALLAAFERDEDVHSLTAAEVFGVPVDQVTKEQRRIAKAVNFGVIYGQSAFGLAKQLGVSKSEAKQYIERYFAHYRGVEAYMTRIIQEATEAGVVTTILGRRRLLPGLRSGSHRERSAAERMARNTPIQGSAADLIKLAMLRCQELLEERFPRARMLLTVHDELVFEVPEEQAQDLGRAVAGTMESVYELRVPLKVDVGVGPNWDEAH